MDCFMNPYGPDDGVRPECKDILMQNKDVTTKEVGELCARIQCASQFQSGVSSVVNGEVLCKCQAEVHMPGGSLGGGLGKSCFAMRCKEGFAELGPNGQCMCPVGGGGPIDPGAGGGDPRPFP